MASSNWTAGFALQEKIPHTFNACQHLIMAMDEAQRNRGKTSFFGHDKGLKSYKKFEDKLKDTLLALTMDQLTKRSASAEETREVLVGLLAVWFEIFPNWTHAMTFAQEKFNEDPKEAQQLIASLMGLRIS